ncbi:unnamed protein product [Rhizoctonia solani]|uniref:Uncharacterized protein n=1 Tax=Rhizoctonia solani TaxID=456999 RepID=A0A8H2X0F9_9AGAM|nr:unnamed protein product [Rhizoctonia solani]
MVTFIWNLALLALAAPTLAIPAPTETLDKRTITSPKKATCHGYTYTQSRVQAAAQAAASHLNARTTVGQNAYPHQFRNSPENFVFQAGCNAPYYEFPILQSGSIFTGATGPGADRVVIGSMSSTKADAVLCGAMTHTGAPTTC